ncbi:MAG: arabinofuranosyltransferase [candidate division Zixibacteria bacterium]|nr:arabinofuranosyltransferase [candidate division Zixibacteria bacterium]
MDYPKSIRKYAPLAIFLGVFIGLGLYVFVYTLPSKPFSEDLLKTDGIRLDVWAFCFFVVVISVWLSSLSHRWKSGLLVGMFSLYGVIAVSLVFNGTPFGFNAYWGDQKFRTAMILKFITFFGWPDFYYKDLPAFYPPLYYFLLSIYARVFSVEAFKMIKIGTVLIYLAGPGLLYWLWCRLTTPFASALAVIATFLFCSVGMNAIYVFPHAFLANAFFVPWWLYYVGQARARSRYGWSFYLVGGVIGGMIFMTYYYVFFIGGLLWVVRTVWLRLRPSTLKHPWHPGRALGVLALAALFSAPYWLPLAWSMITIGADPAQQEWHHADSTGILFRFQNFSIIGMVFLAALYYAVRRRYFPRYRELVLLLGAAFLFFFIGTILGALQKPIIIIKAREFVSMLAGPLVGLTAAGLLRRPGIFGKARFAVPVMASLLLFFLLIESNTIAGHDAVRTARKSHPQTFHADPDDMNRLKGAVFLTGVEELPVFCPVYNFFSINQHYSHPAGRFLERYRFLFALQNLDDPYLLYLAMRFNIYDPIDAIMPRRKDNIFEFYAAVSNYPNRFVTRTLSFPVSLFSDTTLFIPLAGDNLYQLAQSVPPTVSANDDMDRPRIDTEYRLWIDYITQLLDTAGQRLVNDYLGDTRPASEGLMPPGGKFHFGDALVMLSCNVTKYADSLSLALAMYANRDIRKNYRAVGHLYSGDDNRIHDFVLRPCHHITTWKKGDVQLMTASIPHVRGKYSLEIEFVDGDNQLGKPFCFSGREK